MLLTLLTAINNNSRPLFSAVMGDDPKPFVAALEEGQPTRNRLLNAITALLVRNHEIIATVINKSYEQVLALQQSNNVKELGDPDYGTEDESDRVNAARHPAIGLNKSAIFTTVANPMDTETYGSTKHYMFAQRGNSHRWHFGKWDELLQIL